MPMSRDIVGALFVFALVAFASSGPPHVEARAQEAAPATGAQPSPPPPPDPRLDKLKRDAAADVDGMKVFTQQMVDQVFSYGELAFQEVETSRYLTGILEKNGFRIERDYAGIPTAWVATWGSGKPVIALGSDIDCIPQASQKPGVAYHDPVLPGRRAMVRGTTPVFRSTSRPPWR